MLEHAKRVHARLDLSTRGFRSIGGRRQGDAQRSGLARGRAVQEDEVGTVRVCSQTGPPLGWRIWVAEQVQQSGRMIMQEDGCLKTVLAKS